MTPADAVCTGIAFAFVVAVWAMHPSIGDRRTESQRTPQFNRGAVDSNSPQKGAD